MPLSTVIILALIIIPITVGAVFFFVRPQARGPESEPSREETWEYWSGRLHVKLVYNTTEPAISGRNFVQIRRGCVVEINSTAVIGESAFSAYQKSLLKRQGDVVIANSTFLGATNGTIETALYKIRTFYCAQKAFTITAGRYCKYSLEVDCDGKKAWQ